MPNDFEHDLALYALKSSKSVRRKFPENKAVLPFHKD